MVVDGRRRSNPTNDWFSEWLFIIITKLCLSAFNGALIKTAFSELHTSICPTRSEADRHRVKLSALDVDFIQCVLHLFGLFLLVHPQ